MARRRRRAKNAARRKLLRGGQPVAMTADPTDASLIPLGGNGSQAARLRRNSMSFFP